MDFAAFYTAGEALNAELSPYATHLHTTPPLWDGINEFLNSRFLYPPLVATFFQPLARLDYIVAKWIWMGVGLLTLGTALVLANRRVQLQRQPHLLLLYGLLLTNYYPLLAHLERGQIDALNLLLLTVAILSLGSPQIVGQLGAGLCIALATLFKLQVIYFVPFLLWRRQWWAGIGCAVGGVLLLLLTLWFNGADALRGYLQVELPRINQHGDLGAPSAWMDRAAWQALHRGVPEGYTSKDGNLYRPESFFFTKNATTMRNLRSLWQRTIGPVRHSTVSLVAFVGSFGVLVLWMRRLQRPVEEWSRQQQFLFWQLVLLIILLTGPMTWIMNLIWLLPLALALLGETLTAQNRRSSVALAVALVAITLTALPDTHTFSLLVPFGDNLMRWQYVLGELLLFGALLAYLHTQTQQPPG